MNVKVTNLQGAHGAVLETGTTAITGDFSAIQCLEATVFSLLTSANWTGDSTAALAVPAGVVIYGTFSAFTLTSGKVIAYNRP